MLNKVYIIFFVFYCSQVISQDSITRKFNHLVGLEVLRTKEREKHDGHFSSITDYKPGCSVFYRIYIKKRLGFESRLNYRSGFGKSSGGGNGGSKTLIGNFEIVRLDVGVLFSSNRKRSPVNFESGLKVGRTLFQRGSIKEKVFGNGIYKESEIDASYVLNQYYIGFHMGLNFRIKISAHQNITAGFRAFAETRDFENALMNLTGALFVAYRFR